MANRLATKHGRDDARAFADENPEEVADLLRPGQLGADETLINGLGREEVSRLFGLRRTGTRAFSLACADYNRAFDSELRGVLAALKKAKGEE